MVMKALITVNSKFHILFTFSLHGNMCSVNTANIFWAAVGEGVTLLTLVVDRKETHQLLLLLFVDLKKKPTSYCYH
jgi:hypothetical protein